MSTERQRREEAIFHAAREIADPARREAYLRQTCGEDLQLYRDVQELLEAHQASGIETLTHADPGPAPSDDRPMGEKSGGRVDRYQLLEPIGEGGFGVVWMAQQEAPVRRQVALKILKAGMDTRQVVGRFEAERQTLALMEHPNIARVFDGGATESGRPYFVMELVRGQPMTRYCDERRLGTAERLELFMQVCQAVQHAHQKGVIHRDLKPGNILVMEQDGRAVPKVIDFGVAKALEQPLPEKTAFTRSGQMLGTPAYMSPEQASLGGLDIDTRSDVYSLGAVLYELLTGRPPFDPRRLSEAGLEAILRTIREEEPPRPSTRLETLSEEEARTTAEQRRMEPGKLNRLLRGELDWIVMKALEKDRARRYETANGLAMDLLRHLNDEAVSARPPSTAYRVRKIVQKHRLLFISSSGVLAALLVGLATSLWQWRLAEAARSQAMERATAEARSRQEAASLATRLQLKQAEARFAAGEGREGMMWLAHTLRNDPSNRMAAERLLSAFAYRHLAVPSVRPMEAKSWISTASFSPDGTRLLTGSGRGLGIWVAETGTPLFALGESDTPFAAFDSAGKRIVAAATHERAVRVWDAQTGDLLNGPLQHPGPVYWVEFSPDDSWIATATAQSNAAFVWDSATGALMSGPLHHEGAVLSAVFDPGGTRLITASADGTAVIWHWQSTDRRGLTFRHDAEVWLARFSHDGKKVVTCSQDGTARVWDALTGQAATPPLRHQGGVRFAVFSRDDRLIATTATDGTARIWEVMTGQPIVEPLKHSQTVWSAQFSPDEKWLLTSSDDASARLWSVESGRPVCDPLLHERWVRSAVFSPDGHRILTASFDSKAIIWEWMSPNRPEGELPHTGAVGTAMFEPNGRTVLTVAQGAARIWSRGKPILEVDQKGVLAAEFLQDGAKLMTVSEAAGAQLWDANTGSPLGERMLGPPGHTITHSQDDQRQGIIRFHFDRDGNRLAMFASNQAWIIEFQSQQVLSGPFVHGSHDVKEPVRSAFFSPSGGILATVTDHAKAYLWDANTGRPMGDRPSLIHHDQWLSFAAFSPNSRLLVTTGSDRLVKLWNTRDGSSAQGPLRHRAPVRSAAFSPDANTLAAVCEDGTVTLWSIPTGAPLAEPLPHPAPVVAMAFCPESIRLATASGDHAIRIWDVKTGLLLSETIQHPAELTTLTFHPGGGSILTGCADGKARLWPVPQIAGALPQWVPAFAEHLAAKRLDERLVIEELRHETIDEWHRRKDVDLDNPVISPWLRKFFPAHRP